MSRTTKYKLLLLTTTVTLVFPAGFAMALPTGGSVAQGTATISATSTQTTVTQGTAKAVINWGSFDSTRGQTVQFNDPNSSGITLNRVSGPATNFDGALNSNGTVWVINNSGIAFGKDAQVNVGGLLATTSNITDANFMAGTYTFTPGGGPAGATVSNAGNITAASAGLTALVAPNVANSGTITAKLGKITLASGDTYTVDLNGDGLINLQASSAMTQQLLSNTGALNTGGSGSVSFSAAQASGLLDNVINLDGALSTNNLTAINQSGDLEFGAHMATASGAANGSATLSAYRNITVNGGIQGATPTNVTLDSNATAASGGGSIYMAPGSYINSAGGNIVFTGGTGYAVGNNVSGKDGLGNNVYANGVTIEGQGLAAAGGNITVNGQGYSSQAGTTGAGIFINGYFSPGGGVSTSGNGTVSLEGIGGNSSSPTAGANNSSAGVVIANSTVSTAAGGLSVSGTSGITSTQVGTAISYSNILSGSGSIVVQGDDPSYVKTINPQNELGLSVAGGKIYSSTGSIELDGGMGNNYASGAPTTSSIGTFLNATAVATSGNILIQGFAGPDSLGDIGIDSYQSSISSNSSIGGAASNCSG